MKNQTDSMKQNLVQATLERFASVVRQRAHEGHEYIIEFDPGSLMKDGTTIKIDVRAQTIWFLTGSGFVAPTTPHATQAHEFVSILKPHGFKVSP